MTDFQTNKRLIKAALFTPEPQSGCWGLPLLLWGDIGVSKTSVLGQICADYGLGFDSMIGALLEPPDIVGLLMPDLDSMTARSYAAEWIAISNKKAAVQGSCVLLDELTGCPRAVQSGFLRVIHERKAGSIELHKRMRWLAAANPTDVAANGTDIAMPFANRWGHIHWEPPSAEDWCDFMLTRQSRERSGAASATAASDEEARVMRAWPEVFSRATGVVTAFIRTQPGNLHAQPDPNDPSASKAFPTRRTWDMATAALAGAEIHGLSSGDTQDFVAAFVGDGPAALLATHIKQVDLPDPRDLLTGKVKFKHSQKNLSRTSACLDMCAAFLVGQKRDAPELKDMVGTFWGLLEDIYEVSQDMVIPSARVCVHQQLDMRFTKDAEKALSKIYPLLQRTVAKVKR